MDEPYIGRILFGLTLLCIGIVIIVISTINIKKLGLILTGAIWFISAGIITVGFLFVGVNTLAITE